MTKLLTILGLLTLSSTAWANQAHCGKFVGSAAVARAAEILSHDGVEFGSVHIAVGDKTASVMASGGEMWMIQLEIVVENRQYQKIEYISFDQRCRMIPLTEKTQAI